MQNQEFHGGFVMSRHAICAHQEKPVHKPFALRPCTEPVLVVGIVVMPHPLCQLHPWEVVLTTRGASNPGFTTGSLSLPSAHFNHGKRLCRVQFTAKGTRQRVPVSCVRSQPHGRVLCLQCAQDNFINQAKKIAKRNFSCRMLFFA